MKIQFFPLMRKRLCKPEIITEDSSKKTCIKLCLNEISYNFEKEKKKK